MDGRRTPDHGYTISSPCEPNGSGELKIVKYFQIKNCYFYGCENRCMLHGRVFVMQVSVEHGQISKGKATTLAYLPNAYKKFGLSKYRRMSTSLNF